VFHRLVSDEVEALRAGGEQFLRLVGLAALQRVYGALGQLSCKKIK